MSHARNYCIVSHLAVTITSVNLLYLVANDRWRDLISNAIVMQFLILLSNEYYCLSQLDKDFYIQMKKKNLFIL